ncbi:TPA: hypothetical protein QDA98_000715 [Burkholderia vietnamiensis]|nr:hypothetical protein [Burkholderia vietnamiensis]
MPNSPTPHPLPTGHCPYCKVRNARFHLDHVDAMTEGTDPLFINLLAIACFHCFGIIGFLPDPTPRESS